MAGHREGLVLPKGLCLTLGGMKALREQSRDFESLDERELWCGELACELDALKAVERVGRLMSSNS